MSTKSEAEAAAREWRREIESKIQDLIKQLDAADAAIAAITGKQNGPAPKKPRAPRRPEMFYANRITDYLRKNPGHQLEPNELSRALGDPASSTRRAVKGLVARGEVNVVGETPRGWPIVTHKPVSIRPGEPVSA